jgi:hypothetical protein
MATFNLSNRILIVNKSPNVDSDYGPYDDVAAAMTAIPLALRTAGKTIGIISGGIVSEYWWKNNSTLSVNPVLKISTSPESPITLGPIGTSLTSNADGATLTGNVLNLEPASNLFGGVITTTAQTFAGEKTFVKDLKVNGLTVGKGSTVPNSAVNNTAIGIDALKVNTANNNTAIGKSALANNVGGFQNTAIGVNALLNNVGESSSENPTIPYVGIYNTAVGFESLKLNISNNNTAVGISTLTANTIGFQNTAIGSEALKANIEGEENTAVGKDALLQNIDANWNTAVGSSALQGNVAGFQNTAVGRYASYSNFGGSYNTSIGVDSLAANTSSNLNTGLGYKAGYTVTGARNTFLGSQDDNAISPQVAAVTNSIAIGNNAYTTKSNQAVLGNDQITETVLRGEVLIDYGTPSSSGPLSGLRVTMPLQTQTNISPDALLVRINGQTPTSTPGWIGGVVVEADGADNANFYAIMRASATSNSAGFVSRSEDANTTDLFQGLKLSGGVNSTVFKVEHTGDVTATKFKKSGGTPSQILMADGGVIVAGAGIDIGNGVISATGGGSGSSVNYYLNGGTNQGAFGGTTYYELSKTAVIGTGVDFNISSDGYIASFITDVADPSLLLIPAGNWNLEFFFSSSSTGGSPSFYAELYKYDGTTFTLIASGSAVPEGITNGTAIDAYFTALAVPETVLTVNDRLAIRVYVTVSGKTITLHTQNGHLCEVITSFSVGAADLGYTPSPTNGTVTCSTGTDATIPLADATNAGLLKPAKFTVLENTTNSNNGDDAPNSLYSGLATSKQDKLTGPGFVKANAGVITYDNSTYLTSAVITLSGGTTGLTPNTATSGAITLGGTLAIANGGTGAITAPLARTNLGATTIGSNIFTATNPSAITFLRANANNTVDFLSAADFRTAIGAAGQITIGTISTVANSNGASITSSVLNLHAATGTSGGIVTSGDQTFAGAKTFTNQITVEGISIGKGNSTAVTNIAIGLGALDNTTGNSNTVVGYGAASPIGTISASSFTTAVGHEALKDATGNNNTAVGNLAGSLLTTGFQNTFIGASAGSITGQLISAQNSIAIGYQAIADKSNQAVLGNSLVTETVLRGKIIIASPDTSGGSYEILTRNTSSGFIEKVTSASIQKAISIGPIDTGANSNGISLASGGGLTLHAATSTTGGVVTTGNQTFAGVKTFIGQIVINNATNSVLTFNVSGVNKAEITSNSAFFQFNANNTDGYLFKNNASNNALAITQSGNATFLGSATATGFFNSSDARLKDVLERDGDTVKFTWKDGRDEKVHIGYIAQEVQEKYPDQVNESPDGMLTVNYIEVLVAKIQELENRIKQLEK